MKARARAAEETGRRILDAAFELFSAQLFDQVSLREIASAAEVTVQTVIRRFGSKEELFSALAEREGMRIAAERTPPEGGEADLPSAVHALVGHYERDGATVLNFLRQEDRNPAIAVIVQRGRAEHRGWVQRHCARLLDNEDGEARERAILAAIAATDIYVWKLLRLDLARSREDVETTMLTLLGALDRETGGR